MSRELRKVTTEKIHVLKDFGITLSEAERKHIYSLASEIQVDNYAHKLIMDRV